jgi:hypothetical protein
MQPYIKSLERPMAKYPAGYATLAMSKARTIKTLIVEARWFMPPILTAGA